LTELGKPNSEVKLSPTKKIIGYERGDIVISQGKVVKIDLITVEQHKARQNSDSEIRKANEIKPKIEEPKIIQVPEANPLKDFASSFCFIPEEPMDKGLGLGRVDVIANGNDLILVLDIIDNTPRHGGSGYMSYVTLCDRYGKVLAETPRFFLPIGGGKVNVPIKNFMLRDANYPRSYPRTKIQQTQIFTETDVVTLISGARPDVMNAGTDYSITYRSIKQSTK
jgi:hypothetical protein